MTQVKVMSLNHNKISSIEPGTFHDQTLMTHLDLGNNALQTLSGDMWKGLDSLQVLRITENKITNMDSLTFSNLPQLTVVQVDIIQITKNQQILLAPSSYPDTPKPPNITVENVPTLLCDSSTCFLKKDGNKVNYMFNGSRSRPKCTNNREKFWDKVELDCPSDFWNDWKIGLVTSGGLFAVVLLVFLYCCWRRRITCGRRPKGAKLIPNKAYGFWNGPGPRGPEDQQDWLTERHGRPGRSAVHGRHGHGMEPQNGQWAADTSQTCVKHVYDYADHHYTEIPSQTYVKQPYTAGGNTGSYPNHSYTEVLPSLPLRDRPAAPLPDDDDYLQPSGPYSQVYDHMIPSPGATPAGRHHFSGTSQLLSPPHRGASPHGPPSPGPLSQGYARPYPDFMRPAGIDTSRNYNNKNVAEIGEDNSNAHAQAVHALQPRNHNKCSDIADDVVYEQLDTEEESTSL